ncbi:GLPGLI family protein [Chryseobacterium sp. OSA05B]|uniref:GLPGLI family protein n=1 Tax=Chryseobacterium sp. OSA05B TaxID=2862650 RepID=UPI001CBC186A|nr:GLPGLI family protein [Chryseobacterium sp. OSA05B]
MIKLLICLLLCSFYFGQNNRLAYEYTYKTDSLHRERKEKEMMFLDISEKGSNFYSYPRYVYDSLKNAQVHKTSLLKLSEYNFSNLQDKSKVKFSVKKIYPDYEILQQDQIGTTTYTIKKNNTLHWNILPDKKKIKGFTVQKATTFFGGRKWVAWFTDEIPIQDGPYCFHGLPGLILDVEDSLRDHAFSLIGIKKEIPDFEITGTAGTIISPEKFNQLWNNYRKNPSASIKNIFLNSNIQASVSWNGEEMKQSDIIRNLEKRAKEEVETNNNFIELSLYK